MDKRGRRNRRLENGGAATSIRIWMEAVKTAEKELESVNIADEVSDEICEHVRTAIW